MKILIIFENIPEQTDAYLVDDNDGNRNMADALSGRYAGITDWNDEFLDAYERLQELMDGGEARLIWSADNHGCTIPTTDISMVCITGAVL